MQVIFSVPQSILGTCTYTTESRFWFDKILEVLSQLDYWKERTDLTIQSEKNIKQRTGLRMWVVFMLFVSIWHSKGLHGMPRPIVGNSGEESFVESF